MSKQTRNPTEKQMATIIGVIFFAAIVGFITLFSIIGTGPSPQQEYEPQIGETRNFTDVKYVMLTRYEITGTITYDGDGEYFIRAGGFDKDDNLYLTICGSTADHVITDVSNGYYNKKYDRDYDRIAVEWFTRGI